MSSTVDDLGAHTGRRRSASTAIEARATLDIVVIADRIGWEEKSILTAARSEGARAQWLNDGELCCGGRDDLPDASVYLVRSRSMVRGPLLAELLERVDDSRVVNSADAIAICSNKMSALARLRRAGHATVPSRLVLSRADLTKAIDMFGCPLVLKPVYGGLGRRVVRVSDTTIAHSVYDYVEHQGAGFDSALIAQPYLEGFSDMRVLAIGSEPVVAITRRPTEADWRANVEQGASFELLEIDDELRELTHAASVASGAQVFGLDCFCDGGAPLISEINHTPRFRGASEASGRDISHMLTTFLLGLQR
jgi:[lysine-biosynthesis-protein LysW]--L-2-aminoadipate ligase